MVINKFEEKLFNLIDEIDSGKIRAVDNNEDFGNTTYSYYGFSVVNSFEYYLLNDCINYNNYYEVNGNISYYIEFSDMQENCTFVYSLFSDIDNFNESEEIIWIDNSSSKKYEFIFNDRFQETIRLAKTIYEENIKLKNLISCSENNGKAKKRI